jgi:tetratricopeptide (TPR) repeat protein
MENLIRRVFPFCVVVWAAVEIGAAQRTPTSGGTEFPDIGRHSKAKAAELNRMGNDSINAKQFEQAKSLFRQAIQLDPKLSDAYENLALILLLDGNDVAAERTALELLALSPGNYNARLVAGVAALNRSSFTRGKNYLQPLATTADDPLLIAAYSVALDGVGSKAEALQFSAKCSQLPVKAPDALLAGQIFRQPKLKEIAQKWMEASVTSAGAVVNPDLLYMLGTMYAEQGKKTAAEALYDRTLELSPGNVDALVELSELERTLGKRDKALEHLYAAKALAAADAPTLLHFSQVCLRRHMYVDARDALRKVVDQDPANGHAWYQLGLAQFRIGETEAATTDFTTALSLDGNDDWSGIGLGAVLLSSARQQDAAAEFRRVLQRNPHNAAAYYYLAQIHRNNGDIALALHDLQQAVLNAKDDARPWAALGQVQLARHDLSSARTSLKKAIELDPSYSPAHYHMARLLKETGEQSEAAKELELFSKCHDEENKKGIVGLVSEGKWDYAGFLPPN